MPVSTACSQMCEPAVPVSPDRQFRERKAGDGNVLPCVTRWSIARNAPSRGIADHPALPLMNGPPQSCPSHEESSPRPGSHPASIPWTDLASPPANHLGPRASPRPPPIAKPPANHLSPRASPRPPPIAKPPANHLGSRESPRLPRIASAAPIATAAANRHGCRQSPRLPRIASAPSMDAIPSSQRARKPAAADQINGCPRRLSRFLRAGLPIAFAAKPWHQRKRRTDDGDGTSTRSAASGSAEIRYFVQGRPPEMTALDERRQWCATAEHEQRQAPHPADLATVRPTPRQPARSPGPPTQSE
jgi:hypothetical protein